MVRMRGLKWEKAQPLTRDDNIKSSEYYKYKPASWKYLEGQPNMCLLMANEYQRMWIEEEKEWQKVMHPANTNTEDLVKKYVLSFKGNNPVQKPQEKLPFKMKKFQNVPSKIFPKKENIHLKLK